MKNDAIQVLRAVAANAVVLRHIQGVEAKFGGDLLPAWFDLLGVLGVDLFFVISGFVIIRVARYESWPAFLYARVTRIYPAYWVYTTILVAIYLLSPSSLSERSAISLWGSYLLWPTNGGAYLAVGWTLIHEMYFYVVVTLMIACRLPVVPSLLVWAIVVLVWPIQPTGQVAYVVFNLLTLLFIGGALAGQLVEVPAVSLRSRAGRIAVLLGDASYSTYLSHVLVISALWRLLPLPSWLLIPLSLVAANVFGVLSFKMIERPVLTFFRRVGPRPLPAENKV